MSDRYPFPTQMNATRDVLTIRLEYETGGGWEQRFLLQSDVHIDNPKFQEAMWHRHMRAAQEAKASVIIVGDLFDAMQGPKDPRMSPKGRLPQHAEEDYFDVLVDYAEEQLSPYRDNILLLTEGNHETSVTKHHATRLTKRVAHRLNCHWAGYECWMRFMLSRQGNKGGRLTKFVKLLHGSGGGGVVTKGTLNALRRAAIYPQAAAIVSGHIHEQWVMNIPQERITTGGKTHIDYQLHCQLPTLKEEFLSPSKNGRGGYHVEKGRPPKPLGSVWMVFRQNQNAPGGIELTFEPIRYRDGLARTKNHLLPSKEFLSSRSLACRPMCA